MSVFPLRHGDKRPAAKFSWKEFQQRKPRDDELKNWFASGQRNIAIVTGAISGIVVVDIDGAVGEASLAHLEMPETVEVKTPNGRHFYFKHPGREMRNGVRLLPGIDLRADGGYVVAPPSVIDGKTYEFIKAPKDAVLAELPDWVWEIVGRNRAVSPNGSGNEATTFEEGRRNDRLASEAGSLRRRGWSVEDIADALLLFNERHCVPPLGEREVRTIARSMGRYEPEPEVSIREVKVEAPEDFNYGDWDDFQKQIDYHTEQSTRLDTVDMRSVEWLWEGFIPRGMVTIITGEEGLGKSQLALKIAAMFSAGEMKDAPAWAMSNPQDNMPGGLVKLYSAEDPLHQVLAPRMRASGANLAHVFTEGINVQTFLPDGIHDIARGIDELAFGMVIIDPVIAYLDSRTDSNSAQDVRRIMRMLADLAEVSNTVIIGIMHPKKGEETQLLHKMIGGSSAFGQAARSVLGVGRHPDNDDWRVVGRIKGNLSKPPAPWMYEIETRTFNIGADTRISTSAVEFRGPAPEDLDFNAALSGRKSKKKSKAQEDRRPINEAIMFLRAELTGQAEVTVRDIRRLANDAGISRTTLYRAKDELGIQPHRKDDKWWWSLP